MTNKLSTHILHLFNTITCQLTEYRITRFIRLRKLMFVAIVDGVKLGFCRKLSITVQLFKLHIVSIVPLPPFHDPSQQDS